MEEEKFDITGMSCAACSAHVHKAVSALKGVREVNVNLLTNSMTLQKEEGVEDSQIVEAVEKAGYGAKRVGSQDAPSPKKSLNESKETKRLLIRFLASFVLLVPLFYFAMGSMMGWNIGVFGENYFYLGLLEMLLSAVIMLINRAFFVSGFKSLIHGGPNMDTLVSLGSGVAFIYGVAMMFVMASYLRQGSNPVDWDGVMKAGMNLTFETSGMVPCLITIGKFLESYSKGKTTNAIRSLLELAPQTAHVLRNGREETIPADRLVLGDHFVVRPGEAFPADGTILEGQSSVDESALSGEAMPVDKKERDFVSASTINQNGALICLAKRVGKDTTLSQIVDMVENAASSKTKISLLADKVSGIFVPTVLGIATLTFLGWLLFGKNFVSGLAYETPLSYALSRAISVLVVACPCALGLATPVAIMVGSGKGAKNGILFKNASSLEETGKASFVVLDKTGTITQGKPSVVEVLPASHFKEQELIKLACALESRSEHPLAKAVREYGNNKKIDPIPSIEDFLALPGHGLQGKVEGEICYGANLSFFLDRPWMNASIQETAKAQSQKGRTPLLFEKGGEYVGLLSLADPIKEDSKEAIAALKNRGYIPVILSGDNALSVDALAKEAGIRHYASDLLPQDKLNFISKLQEKGKVIMVGDGINDAPALTKADIGVAIGAGADIAIDSADVVLMKGSLMDLVYALDLSRYTMLNIKENLFWAFFYNLAMIPIAAGVFSGVGLAKLKPWYGAAAMALSSTTVCLNALRINAFRLKKKGKRHLSKEKELEEWLSHNGLNNQNLKEENKMEKRIQVEGMMCEHCVAHVKKALEGVKGVTKAEVSLAKKEAVVILKEEVSDETLVHAVEEAGYSAQIA
ncbi:MAG: heavy metal translocating P-type ATPase [Mollicutes bacterium]|nr:heavy metal translocating P-type ATPase [Mollicutes bacterium]